MQNHWFHMLIIIMGNNNKNVFIYIVYLDYTVFFFKVIYQYCSIYNTPGKSCSFFLCSMHFRKQILPKPLTKPWYAFRRALNICIILQTEICVRFRITRKSWRNAFLDTTWTGSNLQAHTGWSKEFPLLSTGLR